MERRLWATRGRRRIVNCFSASVASCGFQLHSFHSSFGFIVSFIISVSTRWLSRQSISVFQQALCIIKTWCVMRLPAVTCRLLFIFGRSKRGGSKRRRERTVAWGVCVCWGFGEITKTLPELVPLLGKQQSLSCSVPLSGLFLSLSLPLPFSCSKLNPICLMKTTIGEWQAPLRGELRCKSRRVFIQLSPG